MSIFLIGRHWASKLLRCEFHLMRKKPVLSSGASIGGSTTMNDISRQHHSLQLPLVEIQAACLKVPSFIHLLSIYQVLPMQTILS